MGTRTATHLRVPAFVEDQDWVVSREQALDAGLTRRAIDYRLSSGGWCELLPKVYLIGPGEPSRRQLMVAALLYAGADAAIDAEDACRYHGIRAIAPDERRIAVVVPQGSPARTRRFVTVRRTSARIAVVRGERLRFAAPAVAVIAATRRMRSERAVLAALSEAVQRRIATFEQLMVAHIQGPPRNARPADRALEQVGAGVRSAPEGDFRRLAEASVVLPPLLYNCLVRLQSGRLISPDALAADAAVVHETNGRRFHAREDLFEDMQLRHDVMTEAGFVVLHNSPARIWLNGREVVAQLERTYLRYAGRGLPPGVELVRLAA